VRTTARIAALIPGASPPLVTAAIRFIDCPSEAFLFKRLKVLHRSWFNSILEQDFARAALLLR
jgi:hypothetical protein